MLGYLDDLVLVPLGMLAVIGLIPPELMAEHRAAAALKSERPVSRATAFGIVLVWEVSIAVAVWLVYAYLARTLR